MKKIDPFIYTIYKTLKKEKDRLISSRQLSEIPHGIQCVIRGGAGTFCGNITFGSHVDIGEGALFLSTDAKLTIGNYVLVGPNVTIITGDHQINQVGRYISEIQYKTDVCDQDVTIEDDVWIGAGSIILKGVTIRRGSVIGAGSVVTHDTEIYSVNAGNPCRKIKSRFNETEIIEHEYIISELNKRYHRL